MGREGWGTVETYEGDNGKDTLEGRWSEASESSTCQLLHARNYSQAQNAGELDYEDQSLATTLPLEKPCMSSLSFSSESHGADQVTRNIPQAPISNSQYPIPSLPGVPLQPSARILAGVLAPVLYATGVFSLLQRTSPQHSRALRRCPALCASSPSVFGAKVWRYLPSDCQDLTSTLLSASAPLNALRIVAIAVWVICPIAKNSLMDYRHATSRPFETICLPSHTSQPIPRANPHLFA
ncbi:hypothetical protein B0H11DRAFT_2200297, partial [Mycena galericulata]